MQLLLHDHPFSVLSSSSPHPSHLNLPATLAPLLSTPPSFSSSFPGPRVGAAITGGGMDSFALMWFGLQRGTAQSDTLSQRAGAALPHRPQFMCFQTGQSTPLSCAGPQSLLPSHIHCSKYVCKKPLAISIISISKTPMARCSLFAFMFPKFTQLCPKLPHLHCLQTLYLCLYFLFILTYFVDSDNPPLY